MDNVTYSARQSLHRDCLATYHVTLAFCPGETSDYFPMPTGIDGMTLEARRVNAYTGGPVKEGKTTYHAAADTKLHLFRSEWKDLFYIAEYQQYRQRYKCSCGGALCEHIRQLIGLR